MTVNRPTRFYFFILLLNISAGSFLLLLVLDAVHSMTPAHTTRGDSLALTIVSLLWPPLSVMISFLVLRYWVNAVLKPSFPLGFDSNFESVDVDVLLGRKMVLLAFLHMLLMLSRLLARVYHLYASSQTFYLLTLAADISGECRPLSSLPSDLASCIPVYWAPIGIQWTLISIIMFSQCLIACNINTIHWGYFRLLHQFVVFLLEATVVIIGASMKFFDAFQGSFRYFQMTWASQSGPATGERAH